MPLHDFDKGILRDRAHRPWPMPQGRWFMSQTWTDLLFAHWRVPAAQIAPRIPVGLQLDLFDGDAWIGVVPFRVGNVAPRGVPNVPGLSAFPELNVRTYVRVGDKPGVFFFSLDAANISAVAAARTLFHLPYYWAKMKVEVTNAAASGPPEGGPHVRYESRRRGRQDDLGVLVGTYGPSGAVFNARPGTFEHFLTERYCLYTTTRRSTLIVEIHHPLWPLQVAHARFDVNTIGQASGLALAGPPGALHFSKRQDVVAWMPRRV